MSQLNVDALASQTGSLVSMASGHTLNAGLVQIDGVTRLGNDTTGYQLETTSDTYADVSGFSVTMTPKSTTNKFVVLGDIHIWHTDTYGGVKLVQNASGSFADLAEKKYIGPQSTSAGTGVHGAIFGVFTPGVTSAVTVKLQAKSWAESSPNRFRVNWYDATSSIILVEIGA